MEKYARIGIYVGIIILIIFSSYFAVTSLNILGGEKQMFPDMVCEEPVDCYNSMIDGGFPEDELDSQLVEENSELICESNICGVQRR